jgi:L-malate glycosyltransferase
MNTLTIGHIDTHDSWRGGQRQVIELIKGLNKLGQRNILFCKASSEIAKKAHSLGIEVVTIPLKGEWDLLSAYELRSHVKKEKLDILHTHTSHAHTLALLALVGVNTCKLVVSRRVDFHIRTYFSRKFKYGNRVDKIISVSAAIKRILIEDGVDPDIIIPIKSGFVSGSFDNIDSGNSLRKQLGFSDDDTVVSTVAALAPHKAHYVLLKAAKIVLAEYPEIKFVFAGEGDLRADIERHIKSLELGDSVTLLGFVEDIGSVYNASDIFAISSEEEGLCTSILDAMYFSLPVVATRAGGIPELVQDGINGYIVPVNDHISFAEKLISLIESPEKVHKMGMRSTDILKQNTIENTILKTLDVYQELCS